MATITERYRKNGKKVFRVEIRIKGNPTLSKSFCKRSEANEWAKQQEVKLQKGCVVTLDADRQSICTIIDIFREEVVSRMRKSTRVNYENQLDWFDKHIGQLSLRRLALSDHSA